MSLFNLEPKGKGPTGQPTNPIIAQEFIKISKNHLCSALGYNSDNTTLNFTDKSEDKLHKFRGWKISLNLLGHDSIFSFEEVFDEHDGQLIMHSIPPDQYIHLRKRLGPGNTIITEEYGEGQFSKSLFFKNNPTKGFFFLSYGDFQDTLSYTNSYILSRMTLNFEHTFLMNNAGVYDALKIECIQEDNSSFSFVKTTSEDQALYVIAVPCPPVWRPKGIEPKISNEKISKIPTNIT